MDPKALEIPDYFTIVKRPMDFGTIKTKLKESRYASLEAFCEDMTLVFDNCKLYNNEASAVGQMGESVREEYLRLCEQLNFNFYKS